MRLVFSRKGFDSGSGGFPSPVIDGRPISLPIPVCNRTESTYDRLGLGEIVEAATRGRIPRDHLCHEDPMFFNNRCAFGQVAAAQGHLANNKVGVGDIFLFFGLFLDPITHEKYHGIFGFLKVKKVELLGHDSDNRFKLSEFPRRHPHLIGTWNKNNTIYVGSGTTARTAKKELRLTQEGGPLSIWRIPSWLQETGLTYHDKVHRWLPDRRLNVVARGQEFVTDIGSNPDALSWLKATIEAIQE